MILIDHKGGPEGKRIPTEMVGIINRLGVHAELSDLDYGDAAFEGRSPIGTIAVGIERKTLHDLIKSIDDARLSGHQLIGMKQMYTVRAVIVEGHWKAHDPDGWLMEGFNSGTSWGYCRPGGQRRLYSTVYRYLISMQMTGTLVTYSRDLWHTCYNICEWFHYFQKKEHTSMLELQKVNIPSLNFKPDLTRRWANDLEDVGLKLSETAARHFRTPIKLANAEESEWLKIPGVGIKTAQQIVKEIWTGRT